MFLFLLLVFYWSGGSGSELLSRHRRSWIINSFSIEEGHPGPFPYELGKINIDRSYRVYFDLYGEGVDQEPKGVLSIHKESGTVLVHRALDYEEKTVLKLKFEARKEDLSLDTKLGVEITVLDINDNPPRFHRDLFQITVDEGTAQGSNLLTMDAYDRDQRGTPNSTFHYEMKSVSPNPPNTEFFIDESGTISFRGCLDYEEADTFTVVVEAKDHGDVVSLSSSTTVLLHVQDANNNLPTISGQSGSGSVKEEETGSSPLRLHATDADSPASAAWRVRYTIQGDDGGHFDIETDPETNDGILTVIKPLDFEEDPQAVLNISVENEAPYVSCTVKERTSSGLWGVDTSPDAPQPHSVKVIILVEDANDPPRFTVAVKDAVLEENSPTGTWVEKVTAVDPDSTHARDFVYAVGEDPAGWVTVDPLTGNITTVQIPDRESPHVVDGVYSILLHAVDNGEPALTGTATLIIHVTDQNDNVPQLTADYVDVCVSDGPPTTNITAFDLDGSPFGGPFTFELLGAVAGRWTLSPSYGFTAGLVKQPGVFAGPHTVHLKVSDMQGQFGVYNLSVTACDCSVTFDCRSPRTAARTAASGVVGVVFAAMFLLLSLILMALVMTCKKEFTTLQASDSSGDTLLVSNIERPGTDCELPDCLLPASTEKTHLHPSDGRSVHDGMEHGKASTKETEQNFIYSQSGGYRGNVSYVVNDNWNQATWNPPSGNAGRHIHQTDDSHAMNFFYKRKSSCSKDAVLLSLLQKRLSSLRETEGDLNYQPHCYADEGDTDDVSDLEDITILDDVSFQEVLKDLGPRFKDLASVCRSPPTLN